MKLTELLTTVFGADNSKPINDDLMLYGLDSTILRTFEEKLKECDEFRNVTDLEIIEIPDIDNERDEVIESKSYKLSDDIEFAGKCYLYGISVTPEQFDPSHLNTPVKNGACITPVFYDPMSFQPKRKISIEFSPEKLQDDQINGEGIKEQQLRELFDDILKSPDDYRVRGKREFIVRGIFEEVRVKNTVSRENIGNLNLDYNNQKNFAVFFLEESIHVENEEGFIGLKKIKLGTDGGIKEVSILLKKQYLPIIIKDRFQKHFPKKGMVNKEELDEFLKTLM